MSYSLNVKAFFFNAKTDYLPYYKNFNCTLSEDTLAKDILKAIQSQNDTFAYPELNLVFKINDLVVEEDTPLSMIVSKLGTTLKIDPVTSYRSNNGLIINNHDFMQRFELLAPYATEADKSYYKSLYALHYASETSNFDKAYIGDAILLLAHKMIQEGHSDKEAILNALTSVDCGLLDCEYEDNLLDAQSNYGEAITALKKMVKGEHSTEPSLLHKIKNRFLRKETTEDHTSLTIDEIQEKHVAYYAGHSENKAITERIDALGIASVKFDRMYKLSGTTILKDNKALAFKKAGATLLSAYDAGAEVLIVEDTATYDMFQENFSAIEHIIGRKMIGLELISSSDFMAQLTAKAA